MKTIKKNVYYCDHCNKRSLGAFQMHKHESGCTANPERECGLCDGRDIKTFIEQLKSRFEIKEIEPDDFGTTLEVVWKGDKIELNEIIDFTEGCPNCTLAILRQTKLNYSIFGFKYNYKAELDLYWRDKNNDAYERDMAESYPY
jgi:hypothetical protein